MSEFFIVSRKHTQRRHRYITLWRPDAAGYCWPLPWAGRYDEATVRRWLSDLGPDENFPVPTLVAEALARPPERGDIDGDIGPAIPNTPSNWRELKAARLTASPAPAE